MINIDVIGMYILKFGLSITISPGSLPIGNFEIQGHKRPANNKIIPKRNNIF
jgi:hypothetical protein